jgi:hypothetical protein
LADLSRLYNFVAGTPAVADEVDAEFDQLVATINNLDDANIASGAAMALSKLAVVPAARVFHSAAQSIASGVNTALAFNSERFDTNVIHDTAVNNSRLVCKTAGVYVIAGQVEWAGSASSGVREVHIRLNGGATLAKQQVGQEQTSFAVPMSVATEYALALNDYVELVVFQNTGGAVDVLANGSYSPEFSMAYLGRAS